MKWQPDDWIRLLALIGALVLFGTGTWMMVVGISAEGAIDIKSSLISGSLKTGSAGLFIVFLSFLIIVFVVAAPRRKPSDAISNREQDHPSSRRAWLVFCALLAAAVGTAVLGALLEGDARALLASTAVLLMCFLFVWMLLSNL